MTAPARAAPKLARFRDRAGKPRHYINVISGVKRRKQKVSRYRINRGAFRSGQSCNEVGPGSDDRITIAIHLEGFYLSRAKFGQQQGG